MTVGTDDLRRDAVRLVADSQHLPYVWPGPPDAQSARTEQAGTCASKHALLAEELSNIGIVSQPLLVVGPLVPSSLRQDQDFAEGCELSEVHECLTVITRWAGPLRIDITWDPPLINRGLPGTLNWDGKSDMALAVGVVGPGWSVPREGLRQTKEALRSRLYAPGQREVRDEILRRLAKLFASWRSATSGAS